MGSSKKGVWEWRAEVIETEKNAAGDTAA